MPSNWFNCGGCQTLQRIAGCKVRNEVRYCAECAKKLPSQRDHEALLYAARVARERQEEADRIAAAYRRGFEDGWRESKLESRVA